jgi:hypothetical protein
VDHKISEQSTSHLSLDSYKPSISNNGRNLEKGKIVGKYIEDSEGFLTVNKRGNHKRKNEAIRIQAVKRDIEVYIGRLIEKTKLEDLVQFIEYMVGIKVLTCRRLNCKMRLCSSFKVVIDEKDANQFFIASDTIWPEGTDIREFVHRNYY